MFPDGTSIPPELEKLVLKCLQKEVDARYASFDEIVRELTGIQEGRAAVGPSGFTNADEDYSRTADNAVISFFDEPTHSGPMPAQPAENQLNSEPVIAPQPTGINNEIEDLSATEANISAMQPAPAHKKTATHLKIGIVILLFIIAGMTYFLMTLKNNGSVQQSSDTPQIAVKDNAAPVAQNIQDAAQNTQNTDNSDDFDFSNDEEIDENSGSNPESQNDQNAEEQPAKPLNDNPLNAAIQDGKQPTAAQDQPSVAQDGKQPEPVQNVKQPAAPRNNNSQPAANTQSAKPQTTKPQRPETQNPNTQEVPPSQQNSAVPPPPPPPIPIEVAYLQPKPQEQETVKEIVPAKHLPYEQKKEDSNPVNAVDSQKDSQIQAKDDDEDEIDLGESDEPEKDAEPTLEDFNIGFSFLSDFPDKSALEPHVQKVLNQARSCKWLGNTGLQFSFTNNGPTNSKASFMRKFSGNADPCLIKAFENYGRFPALSENMTTVKITIQQK